MLYDPLAVKRRASAVCVLPPTPRSLSAVSGCQGGDPEGGAERALTQERAEIIVRALPGGRTAEARRRPWERLGSMAQPGDPGEGERTSLGSRTLPHRAIPEERPRDLPRSAATSGGVGGLCPPAAWDTTALDVRHEPALCPCWRSACHVPGNHPSASVRLFRPSTRAHGGGRLPRVGRQPRWRRRHPYRPARHPTRPPGRP